MTSRLQRDTFCLPAALLNEPSVMNSLPVRSARRNIGRLPWTALALVTALFVVPAGCSRNPSPVPIVSADDQISPDALVVPGSAPWVDTGMDVIAGQPLTISAKGRVAITKLKKPVEDSEREVDPSAVQCTKCDRLVQHVPFAEPRSRERANQPSDHRRVAI